MTPPSRNRLQFGCPRCLTRLEAKPTQAGKNRRCPVCYIKLTVPTPEQVAATAAKWREPGYQLQSGSNQTIPSAAAYQTYFAVICSVCGTRMYATPAQVGQEMRCPDCDTPVQVAPPPTKTAPSEGDKPATAAEEYPIYQGEGQPPADHHEVYQRYIPVVCPICHTRMLATLEQVGQRLICPDCETPSIVPPPEEATHEPRPLPPTRDPNDVYGFAPAEGQAAASPDTSIGSQPASWPSPASSPSPELAPNPISKPVARSAARAGSKSSSKPSSKRVPARDPGGAGASQSGATPPPLPASRHKKEEFVTANCPVCHTRLDVTLDKVGKAIECPDCGTRFAVPRPKTAPVEPDPMDAIEEGYGLAAPVDVAHRKPAVFDAEDMASLVSEEPRSIPDRQGLEEEWKNFNQQLRSMPVVPGERTPIRRSEPEHVPTESFVRGIFTFPFYRSSIAYWLALTLGLMFVVLPPTFAVVWTMKQPEPDWLWVIVASILALFSGLLWILMTSSTCMAILQDTAEGLDEVEGWPEGQVFEWLFDTSYILTAALLSTALGVGTVRLLEAMGQFWWPAGIVVGWLLFPFALVSLLEAGSPLLPFSLPIFRSLATAWWAWLTFYFEATFLFAVTGGLGALVTIPTHYWGSPVAIVLVVTALMIYFRLLGRLVWFCSHTGEIEGEESNRSDDRLVHRRTAEIQ